MIDTIFFSIISTVYNAVKPQMTAMKQLHSSINYVITEANKCTYKQHVNGGILSDGFPDIFSEKLVISYYTLKGNSSKIASLWHVHV